MAVVEAGVIANIRSCDGRWCYVSIADYRGYIEQKKLWGVYESEVELGWCRTSKPVALLMLVVGLDPAADRYPYVAHQSLMPLADGIHGCSGGCGITGNLQGFPLRHGGRESVLPAS